MHNTLTYKESEAKYNQKMSYAEELRIQMEEKKAKEQQAKKQRELEELQHEARIKEDIEREKELQEEKKKQNAGKANRVSFSPQVNMRTKRSPAKNDRGSSKLSPTKEVNARAGKAKELYGQDSADPTFAPSSPLRQAPAAPINRQSYNIYDPSQQLWQKQNELENVKHQASHRELGYIESQI